MTSPASIAQLAVLAGVVEAAQRGDAVAGTWLASVVDLAQLQRLVDAGSASAARDDARSAEIPPAGAAGAPAASEPARHAPAAVSHGAAGPTVLEEAAAIVDGPRRSDYGTPAENHGRTARLWATYLGCEISARDVCWLNVLQKASRDRHSHKRDNLVDGCGYLRNAELLEEAAP